MKSELWHPSSRAQPVQLTRYYARSRGFDSGWDGESQLNRMIDGVNWMIDGVFRHAVLFSHKRPKLIVCILYGTSGASNL